MSTPKLADYLVRVPVTVNAGQTLGFCRLLLIEHNIRHLPVLKGAKVVGVLSERDVLLIDGVVKDSDSMLVERVMSSNPYVVESTANIASTAREMAARRVGSAVLVDGDDVVGVFTTTDALRALSDALS